MDPLSAEILKGGIGYALFLFAVGGVIYLQKQLSTCWKERIDEGKAALEIIHVNTTAMSALTASFDARTRAAEVAARAQEMSAAELATVKQELARLYEAMRK
jgi:hypothetical protein